MAEPTYRDEHGLPGDLDCCWRYLQVRNAAAGKCTFLLGRYGVCGYPPDHELHKLAYECTEKPSCTTPWAHHQFTTFVPAEAHG